MASQALLGNNGSDSLMEDADRFRSFGGFMKWFMRDPCSRWQLVIFLIIGILCIFWIIISLISVSSSYVPAGVCGLLASILGSYYFKRRMKLKGKLDDYESKNVGFKNTNDGLSQELTNMRHKQDDLTETQSNLEKQTEHMRKNLDRFKTYNHNLEVIGKDNIQGISRISAMAKRVENNLRKNMLQSERDLYAQLYDRFELKDKDDGMTFNEYNDFVSHLPDKYRSQLTKRGSFKVLAGDDEKIDFEEFGRILDKMANDFAMGNTASSPRRNIIDDEQKD